MGDLYNFFTKKKMEESRNLGYYERSKICASNIKTNGACECATCKDKLYLSKRLFDIVRYLCKDYKENTGRDLYIADALEIVLSVAASLKIEILK